MTKLGAIVSAAQSGQRIDLTFEHGAAAIKVLNPYVINVFSAVSSPAQRSAAIEGDHTVPTQITMTQEADCVTVSTDAVTAKIYADLMVDFYDAAGNAVCCDYRGEPEPLPVAAPKMIALMEREGHMPENISLPHKIEILKQLRPDDRFYGLGDKVGFLDRRHYAYEMWNTDNPAPHTELFTALYKSIPFFVTLGRGYVYGIFFDNHSHAYFDMGRESEKYYRMGADGGNLDYYYIAGSTMPEIIARYTELTGRTPLPQLWTLGHHQSRWSYMDEAEIRGIAEKMRAHHIPCDAIHLDIDYMDHYKVFTWSDEASRDPKKMVEDLGKDGFKIVTIIDPGTKVEKGYRVYEEGEEKGYFCKTPEGETYINEVWPGDSAFPDFGRPEVREWWGRQHTFLLERGVRGVWNDMNEPASFRGPLPNDVVMTDEDVPSTHAEMHNVFGHNMSKATYQGIRENSGKRPYVISRACYAGSQKYTTLWTGDNTSLWAHLQTVIPQLTTLGLCGFGFAGTDLGGFGGDTTPELLQRWVQVAAFSTMMRNHSCMGSRYQEPWQFGEEVVAVYRKYVQLHYKLIPTIYDLFREGEKTGLAPLRPLVLHYEKDERAGRIFDEALLGENILISPVVMQGAEEKAVYLPEGEWIDYWTGERHIGPCSFLREAPIDVLPIYVKAGTILPHWGELEYIPDAPMENLIVEVFPGEGSYVHYQDNGADFAYQSGEYNAYEITQHGGTLTIDLTAHGYAPTYKTVTVVCGDHREERAFEPHMEFSLA